LLKNGKEGIQNFEQALSTIKSYEIGALVGAAGNEAREGEKVDKIIKKYEILFYESITGLENIAIKDRLKNNSGWQNDKALDLKKKMGICSNYGLKALECEMINHGAAGNAVWKGDKSPEKAHKKWGFTQESSLTHLKTLEDERTYNSMQRPYFSAKFAGRNIDWHD
jgi:hypothetical protein